MKLAIHPTQGKSKDANVIQAMAKNWANIDVNWSEAWELITVDGYATTAELISDHRIGDQFASRQLLMVDIDNDPDKDTDFMSISELLEHPFYNAYGAGFYATHSFRPEQQRYRICFILAEAETNFARCRKIIRALLKIFPAGDQACKDPVRLFYGNPGCEIKEHRLNTIPRDIVDALVQVIDEEDQAQMQSAPRTLAPMTSEQQRKILELLKQTFVGEYHVWRNIGWGLKAGGFSLEDFQYVTQGLMREKTPEKAAEVWNDGRQVAGGVTMGTVIHLLRERHGQDCLKISTQDHVKYLADDLLEKYGK